MSKMAQLYAALTELPDQVKEQMELGEVSQKSEFMQGFFRGRSEGLLIGQEEGAFSERERIIKLLEDAQITTVKIPDPVTFEPREIKVRCEAVRADLLIALIKGEQNADIPSV